MTDSTELQQAERDIPGAAIRVTSATGRYSSTVSHAAMSLIVGTGTLEGGQSVLVPFIECEIALDEGSVSSSDDTERSANLEEHSILVTLENTAFLAEAFSSELARLLPDLVSFSQGSLKPVPDRIAYAIERLQQTKSNISIITETLEKFSTQIKAQP